MYILHTGSTAVSVCYTYNNIIIHVPLDSHAR